jgi:hypothetical protein
VARTVLFIALIAAAVVIVLKLAFDIDAIELVKGFLGWLFDLVWGNRELRRG